jgi:flagellar motor switch protein FliM
MADDVLTSEELAALRSAPRAAHEPHVADSRTATKTAPPGPLLPAAIERALTSLAERWAAGMAAPLASLVRRPVQARLVGLSQTTSGGFASRLERPACVCVLSAEPRSEHWTLVLDAAILDPLLDGMLGGSCRGGDSAHRPPTDIELRLATRVAGAIAASLEAVWRDYVDGRLTVERVESWPGAIRSRADEAVVWLRVELTVENTQGAIHLVIPSSALVAVAEPLTGKPLAPARSARQASETPAAVVELVARLAQSQIAPDDAARLDVGDMIATDQPVGTPIAVVQDGVVRFHGRVGSSAGRKAVEIEPAAPDARDVPPESV